MESYRIAAARNGERTVSAWFRRFLPIFFVYTVTGIALDRVWPGRAESSFLWRIASGVVWAAAYTFTVGQIGKRNALHYDLLVGDDAMTAQYAVSFKTIHKDSVRTVLERGRWISNGPGVMASERGRLGTWLWGGVFIPEDLPEHERLKDLVLSWKVKPHEQNSADLS